MAKRGSLFCVVILLFTPVALAGEQVMPEVLPPLPIWEKGKLTPEQPFRARVKAISGSWMGYTLLLEEVADDKPPRSCLATIGIQQITYGELPTNEATRRMKHPHMHTTFFEEPIKIKHFRWENGLYRLGHTFGKDDSLRQWYISLNKPVADDP